MKRSYTVSQDKESGLWYAHYVKTPHIPCMINGRHTFCKTKREAQKNAAMKMYLPYNDYMSLEEY